MILLTQIKFIIYCQTQFPTYLSLYGICYSQLFALQNLSRKSFVIHDFSPLRLKCLNLNLSLICFIKKHLLLFSLKFQGIFPRWQVPLYLFSCNYGSTLLLFMKCENHLALILAVIIIGYVIESSFLDASICICIHCKTQQTVSTTSKRINNQHNYFSYPSFGNHAFYHITCKSS